MGLLSKPPITERYVLRAMAAGFLLVLLLLGAAGLSAVRGARLIESNTAELVKEQLLASRLLNDVQAEQDTLTAVLHEMSRRPETLDPPGMLHRLDDADASLERMISGAANTPEAAIWRQLSREVRAFSTEARVFLESGRQTEERLDRLFAIHDDAARLVHRLLAESSRRVARAENLIEEESRGFAREPAWLLGACFGLALIFAWFTIAFSRWTIRQMEWQANELNKVSWHMLQSQEAAARRFSHELHDELGQSLAAVKANLIAGNPGEFAARRTDCLHLVDEAIANVRELSQLLRPVILDDFGLDAGLRWLTEKFAQRTGLSVEFHSTVERRLQDETETHLFRIAQEALTNVARHSGATQVKVELHEVGARIWLRVEDNGRGISEPAGGASLGMTGMRARAQHAGGELMVSAGQNRGVRIEVWVPVQEVKENADAENANSFG